MRLQGKKVVFLIGKGFEDLEFWVPYMRLKEEGAQVSIVGIEAGQTYSSKSGALKATSEVAASDIRPEDYDAVVVPGGWCPDHIRRYEPILSILRNHYQAGKIIGMICHAGSVGISADIVRGHEATGSEGIKDDLVNAGATWVDKAAFRSGNLVWGRVVEDIPDFCRELVAAIAEG